MPDVPLLPFDHLRPSALGSALARHAERSGWRWRVNGREIQPTEAFARDGWLPAIMAGTVWETLVPWDCLAAERFVAYEEPHPFFLGCGFFLDSDPSPTAWSFAVWRHLTQHQHEGWVDLDCSVNAWLEGLRGSPGPLPLAWRALPDVVPEPVAG